jgi:hypothetical protein
VPLVRNPFKLFTPRLKKEVNDAVKVEFSAAPGDVETDNATPPPEVQIMELRRLSTVLEAGSSSLNQRATTLAGLAVAGIGTFGLFAGKLAEVDGAHGRHIVAYALVAATVFLALGAAFALVAVLPGGKWGQSFAEEAKPLIEGKLNQRGEKSAAMVAMQLKRNSGKAVWMKRAYRSTGLALIAIVVAVVAVAHQEAGTTTVKHGRYSAPTSAVLSQRITEEASVRSRATVLSVAISRVRQQNVIAGYRHEPVVVLDGYEFELAALSARLGRVRKDEARLAKVIVRLRDLEAAS